jgi:hypothetical protein
MVRIEAILSHLIVSTKKGSGAGAKKAEGNDAEALLNKGRGGGGYSIGMLAYCFPYLVLKLGSFGLTAT